MRLQSQGEPLLSPADEPSEISGLYRRQLDLIDPGLLQDQRFCLVGCGSLGSALALSLAKMGATWWALYDGDSFEPHNLPNQLYFAPWLWERLSQAGIWQRPLTKAEALGMVMNAFSAQPVHCLAFGFFRGIRPDRRTLAQCSIIIVATDNLESRKLVYRQVDFSRQSFFDARSGGLGLSFYSLTPNSSAQAHQQYQASLQGPGYELPCTGRAIAFSSFAAGTIIPALVRSFLMKKEVPTEIHLDLANFRLCKFTEKKGVMHERADVQGVTVKQPQAA